MSLQQALRQIPSVNRVEKLRQTLAVNRWSVGTLHLDTSTGFCGSPQAIARVKEARQAFFTAQDELNRLLGRG